MSFLLLSPEELEIMALTLRVATVSTLASFGPALYFAWILSRHQFPGKLVLDNVLHLPLVVPPVVIGYLLLLAFNPSGPAGAVLERFFGIRLAFNWLGASLACSIMSLPLMIRSMRLAFDAQPRYLEETAQSLGARPLAVFMYVTLPLSFQGVVVALLLGFARALGEFGATVTFAASIPGETRTLALGIYHYAQIPGQEWRALRLTILALVIAFIALWLSYWQGAESRSGSGGGGRRGFRRGLGRRFGRLRRRP